MMQGHGHLHRQQTEKKKSEPVKQAEAGEMQAPEVEVETSAEQVMYLQRTIGNQATNRFLQAKRASIIQRDGEGGAVDPSSIPAPAPALDPAVAQARFIELVGMSASALDAGYDQTEKASEVAKSRAQIEAARDEIQTKIEKLRTQPVSESVTQGIEAGTAALAKVATHLTEINTHHRAVESGERAEAAGLPHPAISRPGAPSSASPAPSPAPAPAPQAPLPAFVPDDPGVSKADKAKRNLAIRQGVKAVGSGELIAEQDSEAMLENAESHYSERPERAETVPDPDGSKTSGLFAPLKAASADVKSFTAGAADKIADWLHPFLSFLDSIPGVSILVGLVKAGWGAYSSYGWRKAFSTALTASNARIESATPSPTKTELAMQKTADYAYKKTNRAFWGNVAKFFTSLVKYVLRLITILTGGASALGTETAALVIDIGQAIDTIGHKIKGGVKYIFGKRGKNRRTNATTVYNNALAGDRVALKLVLDLKPFGTWDKVKAKLPLTATLPANETEMLNYLNAHGKGSEQQAIIMEIADKMKSG